MERNTTISVEGFEEPLRRDIALHRTNLQNARNDLDAANRAMEHLQAQKSHYRVLIAEGGRGYSVERMREIVSTEINVEIRKATDFRKLATDRIEHFSRVVDALVQRLAEVENGKHPH